jgi:regulator of replication initiation timing
MIQVSNQKLSPTAIHAFEEIGVDVWTGAIAEALEIAGIVHLRAVSKSFHAMMSGENMWLDQLTLLSLSNPMLADLERGAEESAYAWYARCHAAVDYGNALAQRHKEGGLPYLELYGVVEGNNFTPHAELRFPMPWGFIAELVALKSRAGCRDAPYDALLCFPGAPASCDHTFRRVMREVKAATSRATLSDLRQLPDMLAKLFAPAPPPAAASAEPPARTPTRTLDTLQRRLGHMSVALARADARIEELEAENAKLREVISQKDEVIATLRQTIYELKAELREARGENAELRAENANLTRLLNERPTDEEMESVQAKLDSERKARRAAERQIAAMKKERTTLRRMLTIAERGYDEAAAAAAQAKLSADQATAAAATVQGKGAKKAAEALKKAAALRLKEAELERDAAAQVAAAQFAAQTWIEDALDEAVAETIASRGLMTAEEMVDYARVQSAVGAFSSPLKQIAAVVMSSECRTEVTMPTTSASGRGRGVTYMRVAKAIKPSDQLTPKQLRRRSEEIRAAVDHHSAGAPVAQVRLLSLPLDSPALIARSCVPVR